MAANVEVDETNGAAPGTLSHGIPHGKLGSVDQTQLTPANALIIAGQNSFEKWLRFHLTDLGGAVKILGLRFFSPTTPAANTTFHFNGHTVQATYDSANHKQTVYATPATSATRTPEAVPTVEPASANLGIGGSLTGELTAPGSSDFLVIQVRSTTLATAGVDLEGHYQWDEGA